MVLCQLIRVSSNIGRNTVTKLVKTTAARQFSTSKLLFTGKFYLIKTLTHIEFSHYIDIDFNF